MFDGLINSFSENSGETGWFKHEYSDNVFKPAYLSRLFKFRHYAILIDFGKCSDNSTHFK